MYEQIVYNNPVGFVLGPREFSSRELYGLNAISLYAGAGISDVGYTRAGFSFLVHSELDERRSAICARNFPQSKIIAGDLRKKWRKVVSEYEKRATGRLTLLAATPPCQGMSSSNPNRGKVSCPDDGSRDERNLLLLSVVPLVRALQPRVVVVENVPQMLLRTVRVRKNGRPRNIVEAFHERLPNYRLYSGIVQMADYGIPQVRRRSILTLIHEDEAWAEKLDRSGLLPWPARTHAENSDNGFNAWVTFKEWAETIGYPPLDAKSKRTAVDPDDPLHHVPFYDGDHYYRVADIPPNSGASAYKNSNCRSCCRQDVPEDEASCPSCGSPMWNRPIVVEKDGTVRPVKGFKSSYCRMHPDRPAQTITTASSHWGSDYKVHPWENRVLSIRECADLQTIPRSFDWSWAHERGIRYVLRQVIGEAFPPYFTYLHGLVLRDLLGGKVKENELAGRNEKAPSKKS